MLSPKQQAFELFSKSQNILIVLPKNHNADSLGAGLALTMLAKDLGKKADLVVQEPVLPILSFLPGRENIKNEISSIRDFIISIDTSEKKIKQLRYENKNATLKIYLAGPDNLEEKDIKLEPGPFVYDATITIDAADLEALENFYEKYTDLFFQKPVLNIDHKSGNEHFGEVNLIEPTFSSGSEIIADFVNSFFPSQISEQIATCLLAGIIQKTHSFQRQNTSPQTFALASLLITRGADKEKIIQHLYKTKTLNYLKFWGKLLTQLELDSVKNLAWLEIAEGDLRQNGCGIEDLKMISEEINDLLPGLSASVILWQAPPEASALSEQDEHLPMALVQSQKPEILQKLATKLNGHAINHQVFFEFPGQPLIAAKEKIWGLINSLV